MIEKDELLDPSKPSSEVKLPEEIQAVDDPNLHDFEGPKTWEVKVLGFYCYLARWIIFNKHGYGDSLKLSVVCFLG